MSELLTPERIRIIAEEVMEACQADGEYLSIKKIKAAIKETDEAIENLWIALEKGQSVDRITKRLEQREAEKKDIEKQLDKEKRKQPGLQLTRILAFLDYLRELPGTSEVKKKSLINIFVHSVHLYYDYFYIIFNAGNTTLRSENIPLKSIENSLKQAVLKTYSGSDFDAFVPPNETEMNPDFKGSSPFLYANKWYVFLIYSVQNPEPFPVDIDHPLTAQLTDDRGHGAALHTEKIRQFLPVVGNVKSIRSLELCFREQITHYLLPGRPFGENLDLLIEPQITAGHAVQKISYHPVVEFAGIVADGQYPAAVQDHHLTVGGSYHTHRQDLHLGAGEAFAEQLPRACHGQNRPVSQIIVLQCLNIAGQDDADPCCRFPFGKNHISLLDLHGSGAKAVQHGAVMLPVDPAEERTYL